MQFIFKGKVGKAHPIDIPCFATLGFGHTLASFSMPMTQK